MLVVLAYAALLASAAWSRAWFIGADGHPMPADFQNVWTAGAMVLQGRAPQVWDWTLHAEASALALGRPIRAGEYFGWHYPPPFLLVAAPLARLPYLSAWLVWILASGAGFYLALRLILPPRPALVLTLAAPASLWCAVVGQNGFATAALATACLALLERRPWLAGFLLGLLAYKPHFGLLFPLFLLLGRRWATFLAASATVLGIGLASLLVLGAEAWLAFFRSIGLTTQDVLLAGGSAWPKLQTLFSLAYQVTADRGASLALHAAAMLAVLAVAVPLWRSGAPLPLQAASLLAASYLAPPYAYAYDLVLLSAAIGFLLQDMRMRGGTSAEKAALAVIAALAGLAPFAGSLPGPLMSLALLALARQRAGRLRA